MTTLEIKQRLLDFNYRMCNESESECPISVTSTTEIPGEDAELIHFVFGKLNDPCVAIVYSDGTLLIPYDWQDPELSEDFSVSDIANISWIDERCVEATMFNGMPRILV